LAFSCSRRDIDEHIQESIDKYDDYDDNLSQYDYQKNIGKEFSAETEYKYDENSDNMDGIVPIFNQYKIYNNKIYFNILRRYDHSDEQNADMLAYIDINNGTKHYLCPDSLCKHTYSGECKYLGFFDPVFLNENIFYSTRLDMLKDVTMDINDMCFSIYKIETEKDIVEKIYSSENFSEFIFLMFISNNKLYFFKAKSVEEENKEKSRKEIYEYYTLDLSSNKTEKVDSLFSDDIYSSYFFSNGKYIYFRTMNDFFVTDTSYNNKKIVYSLRENENFSDFYYDRNTDEMYFGVNNITDNYGYIYKTGDSLECEKLDMPNDNVYNFQLSSYNIYYSVYDPIIYGENPFGTISTDETGEKIYKTDRKNPSVEIPVFDGKGEFYLGGGYIIAGDYLYINYAYLIEEDGQSWFRSAGTTVRINPYEKTIKWLNFD
jgi:hypothetical protein